MPARRLVIVDPSLKGTDGHYFDYDVGVAGAARQAGLEALVVAAIPLADAVEALSGDGRPPEAGIAFAALDPDAAPTGGRRLVANAMDGLARVAPDLPTFLRRTAFWRRGRRQGPDASVMAVRWARLLADHAIGPGDHVLLPTPEPSLLSGLLRHLRDAADGQAPGAMFHLVMRRDLDETGSEASLIGEVAALLATITGAEASRFGLRFHADTRQLGAQYAARFPQLRFTELPIPVRPMDVSADAGADGVIDITCLGNARREKGFHLLGDVVPVLARLRERGIAGRLVVQTNTNLAGGEPGIAATARRLRDAPEGLVRCVEGPLTSGDYAELMSRSALVLLPYDPALYLGRSSGVFAEALALGKPVIVPDRGWMAAETHPDHGVTFAYPTGLAAAVETALTDYARLRHGAEARAAAWREVQTAERLVAALLTA